MTVKQWTVGVVGAGTVGGALLSAFDGHVRLLVRDPQHKDGSCSIQQLVDACDAIFIAVPTPFGADGDADLSVFHSVTHELIQAGAASPSGPVCCVKSAVPPGAIRELLHAHPALRLVVSPEFLRQRSPVADMLAMRSLVLGGNPADCRLIETLFREHSSVTGPMRTSPGLDAVGAAFLKYQENCFLAVKVSFMNEFFDLFQHSGSDASWDALQTAFHRDHERMGSTHWHVPGPDGKRGWGGHCLPKDLSATRVFAKSNGVPTPVLDAVWQRNLTDRQRTDIGQDSRLLHLTHESVNEPRPDETR